MNEPVLVCRSVKKSYPLAAGDRGVTESRLEVLKGIDFEVQAGERLAIMGRSGGGKSTLLGCLSGLDQIDSGEIYLLGKNLAKMSANDLNAFRASTIGIVFQQFQLLDHFTALENVRLPLDLSGLEPEAADAIAKEKLGRVGLGGRESHFPDRMSRGECQRVAIARVLAMGVKLIYADEPTGSLDVKTGRDVMDLLFESAKESRAALVLVTHDPLLARRCDRILRIEDGVLKDGPLVLELPDDTPANGQAPRV
jgi:putative ABC transport system ATP-binding protein